LVAFGGNSMFVKIDLIEQCVYDIQQQQQLPNISCLCGVWGDPDVHDLTPMRKKKCIERSFPTDPHKIILEK